MSEGPALYSNEANPLFADDDEAHFVFISSLNEGAVDFEQDRGIVNDRYIMSIATSVNVGQVSLWLPRAGRND